MCLSDPNCNCNKISDVRALRDDEIFLAKHTQTLFATTIIPQKQEKTKARILATKPIWHSAAHLRFKCVITRR